MAAASFFIGDTTSISETYSLIEERLFNDSNDFVELISWLKTVFLNKNYMPNSDYIHFMKYLLSNLENYSTEQLKTIERFCLRMDEDALTGIVKYLDTHDGSKTSNYLYYLFKKYNMEDAGLICEIIKKGHVNISNSLINMLAKNIRINKPMCKYNTKCYRKNIDHLKTYLHN